MKQIFASVEVVFFMIYEVFIVIEVGTKLYEVGVYDI